MDSAARDDQAPEGIFPQPVSKTEYVVERLRRDIQNGHVRPGDQLRQVDIAARYGVSPTPVREALRILEADGTISYAPHRGATVRELSPTRTEDLYRLRADVEGLAAAIAAERLDDEAIDQIRAANDALNEASRKGDPGQQLSTLNRRLHFVIYEAGSSVVAAHASSLWTLFPPHVTIWRLPSAASALQADHSAIIEAIIARDPELARSRMSAHILHAHELRREQESGTA